MALRSALSEFFLSSVFPRKCLVCGSAPDGREEGLLRENADLCAVCSKQFVFLSSGDMCSVCGNPFAGGGVCGSCIEGGRSFSIARSIFLFSGAAAKAGRRFKYGGDFSLGRLLSSLAVDFFPSDMGEFDVVVPVPLHPGRIKTREFNQCCVISSKLASAFAKCWRPFVLERVRNTAPQASFARSRERKANVRGAFSLRESEKDKIKGKKVMLFDDIFTTGSTVEECSAALVSGGVAEVKVLTVFRTPV